MKKGLIKLLLFVTIFFISPHVFATEWKVCPVDSTDTTCSHKGPVGLQQAVDEAKNDDTITIQAGKYEKEDQRTLFEGGGVKSCFIDLRGKNLKLIGEGSPKGEWSGAVLFGAGHDATTQPNDSRAGICSDGGSVTIDSLHIKEFQGGCMNFTDTKVVIKNSVIDGCDSGGVRFSGNSSVMSINSYYVAVIGLQPSRGASVKAINNVFSGKAIDYNCNEAEIPPIDFVNNVVSDIEEIIGIGWITSTCPEKAAGFKKQNIKYNVMWKDGRQCYPHEYCDFTQPNNANKNINADPQLDSPAMDQRGWRWGGDFSPKDGSPAIGAGDPSADLPGPKNIGGTGGPCVDGKSAICINYIKNSPPREPIAIAPPQADNPPVNNNLPAENNPPADLTQYLHNYVMTPLSKGGNNTAGFFLYIFFAAVYIMTIHLAIAIGDQFNIFLMAGLFVLGAVIGFFLQSYELGFVFAMISSLVFW